MTATDMNLATRIEAMITPTVEDMGFEIVRVLVVGSKRPRLQIMAERKDGSGIDVEDCAQISRAVSALLDVEDPIRAAFTLEVSSPGIDRPLTRPKDYVTWAGFDAKVELGAGIDGQKRFTGRLMGLEDGGLEKGAARDLIVMETEAGERVVLPFDDVQRAKLLLTDELIAAATTEQNQ